MKHWEKLFFTLVIFFAGFFSLYGSFGLALFGDDWLALWRYTYHLGEHSSKQFNHLTYFLTVYGPQDVIMGLLEKIFHLNSLPYFIISFLFRISAAFSLFPVVFHVTKSKLAGLIASIFFAATFIGIETTNWVFNMPSYLGLTFFNLFLYFFLISREKKQFLKIFFAAIFFYLAFIVAPIRMTGLPLIVLVLEIFLFIQKRTNAMLRLSFFRLGIIACAFLAVKFGGQSLGTSTEMVGRVITGISVITNQVNAGHTDIFMNPFILLGSLFIPDIIWDKIIVFTGGSSLFLSLLLPLLLVYMAILFLIYKATSPGNDIKRFLFNNMLPAFLWTLAVRFISVQNPFTFGDPFKISEALIGGYFVILTITLIQNYWKTPQGFIFFLSFIIIILSFIFPWFFSPTGFYSTSHRYLILTAIGMSIFWASFVTLSSSKTIRFLTILIFILFITLQLQANQLFFSKLLLAHGNGISDAIWSQLQKDLPDFKTAKHPLVFYFEGDTTNSAIINDVITFGFPPHIGHLYEIFYEDDRIPIPVNDYKELEDIIKTGTPMSKYGRKQKPLPINQIYAFRLEGRIKLTNITDQTREKLGTISAMFY